MKITFQNKTHFHNELVKKTMFFFYYYDTCLIALKLKYCIQIPNMRATVTVWLFLLQLYHVAYVNSPKN